MNLFWLVFSFGTVPLLHFAGLGNVSIKVLMRRKTVVRIIANSEVVRFRYCIQFAVQLRSLSLFSDVKGASWFRLTASVCLDVT
jgi:hypothetical protein